MISLVSGGFTHQLLNMSFLFPGQLGALHEVLEKLQAKRLPLWEKKFGQVPTV